MPNGSKREEILTELAEARQKQKARYRRFLIHRLLDDLSDMSDSDSDDSNSDDSNSMRSSRSQDTDMADDTMDDLDKDSDSESVTSSDLEDQFFELQRKSYLELVEEVMSARVLDPSPGLPKASQLHLLDEWAKIDHPNFRKKVRVRPSTFDKLVEIFSENEVFYNNSNVPQLPVRTQLSIFLTRMGHFGNAASPEDISQWAGVGYGTVNNATNRCIVACLGLHDKHIHLPTATQKEKAKAWIERETCPEWRDGFLEADGTKFKLFERPGLHGQCCH